ncbi:MAG: hypothetical protein CEE43_07855 [Promethearchaeota archaeon Loki_b32]|nr:MAG: hypothetical protein CEE43_07855 [Candidatus Lokiarchaeota archaeon Loki_b32]
MSFFKNEIGKYKRLFYIKLGIIITLICISLLSLFLLISPETKISFYLEDNINWFLIDLLAFFTLILTSLLIILTVNQYKDYFRRKTIVAERYTYLSFEDIFENENRKNIINKILQEPGIHNNELLRKCNLQKGQLQWHLYVLLQYGIIKKEKLGQYVSFFPVLSKKEMKTIPLKLITKSKTSIKILDLIEKNPGINSAKIAKKLDMSRSSVKYHVDKLAKLDLIILERYNREIKLYVNQKE